MALPDNLNVDPSSPSHDKARSYDSGFALLDEEGLRRFSGKKWAKSEWHPSSQVNKLGGQKKFTKKQVALFLPANDLIKRRVNVCRERQENGLRTVRLKSCAKVG